MAGFDFAVRFRADDKVTAALAKLQNKIENIQKATNNAGKSFSKMSSNISSEMDKVNAKMTKQREGIMNLGNAFLAAGAMVGIPVKAAVDFESAMANVKKVIDFDSPKQFQQMGKDFRRLAIETGKTAIGIAEIASAGGSLGIATKDILEFTKLASIMSVAFDMSTEDAGDSMGKMMNIYHLSMKQVNDLGDTINALDATMAAKSRDIVNVVSRIGGTADVFGLSAKAAGGLASAFLALGKPPEVAATGINAMLLKLGTAEQQGAKFQNALKKIGVSAGGLKKAIDKDAQGALTGFLHTLAKVDKTKQMGILSDMFGAEYSDDLATLVRGLNQYDKAMGVVGNTTENAGSMQREFAIRMATTQGKIDKAKASANDFMIELGNLLLPVITKILNKITPMITDLTRWAEQNKELAKTIMKVVGGIALVIGAILIWKITMLALTPIMFAVSMAMMAYANRMAIWAAITKGAAIAMRVLNFVMRMNPIGLVVTAIFLLIEAFGGFGKLFPWLTGIMGRFWAWLENKIPALKKVSDFVKGIGEAIGFGNSEITTNQKATLTTISKPLDSTTKNMSNVNVNLQAQGMTVKSVDKQSTGAYLNVGVNSLGNR
jgi:TP901 family phage tail tape measure protein